MAIIKIKNAAGEWEDLVSDSLEDNSPSKALSAKQGKILDESKADKSDTYTKTEVNSLSNGKIDKPTSSTPAGKFMQTDDHGNAIWGDGASGAEVGRVVTAWLEENISDGQTIAIDKSLSVPGAAAESATVGNLLGEIIQVADEEPTDEFNKIWVEETPDSEIEIPDYEDFENLVTVSSDEPTAPANKVWIKPSGLGEVAVTTYEEFTGVIAPDYDTINVAGSMPIKVGQHCIHNGEYYSCKIEITEPETFTLSHWTKMTVGSEASDLKSAFDFSNERIIDSFHTAPFNLDKDLFFNALNWFIAQVDGQFHYTAGNYRVASKGMLAFYYNTTVMIPSGTEIALTYPDGSGSGWKNPGHNPFTIPAGTFAYLVIRNSPEDTSITADVETFVNRLTFNNDLTFAVGEFDYLPKIIDSSVFSNATLFYKQYFQWSYNGANRYYDFTDTINVQGVSKLYVFLKREGVSNPAHFASLTFTKSDSSTSGTYIDAEQAEITVPANAVSAKLRLYVSGSTAAIGIAKFSSICIISGNPSIKDYVKFPRIENTFNQLDLLPRVFDESEFDVSGVLVYERYKSFAYNGTYRYLQIAENINVSDVSKLYIYLQSKGTSSPDHKANVYFTYSGSSDTVKYVDTNYAVIDVPTGALTCYIRLFATSGTSASGTAEWYNVYVSKKPITLKDIIRLPGFEEKTSQAKEFAGTSPCDLVWSLGGVSYNDGTDVETTRAVRTDYFQVEGNLLNFANDLASTHECNLLIYNSSKVFQGQYGAFHDIHRFVPVIPGNYYRIYYQKIGGGDPMPDTSLSNNLHVYEKKVVESLNGDIPGYWWGNLNNAVDKIVEHRQDDLGKNHLEFILLGDPHYQNGSHRAPSLINYISKRTKIRDLIVLGDIDGYLNTQLGISKEINEFYGGFDNNIRIFNTNGNHDINMTTLDAAYPFQTVNSLYANMYKQQEWFMDTRASIIGNYFDDKLNKVRYINVDSSFGITEEAKTFLQNTITSMENGWGYIIITHTIWNANIYDPEPVIDPGIEEYFESVLDYTPANVIPIALFCGHIHQDLYTVFEGTTKSIPVISVTTDSWYSAALVPVIPMTPGTDTENAFDVVQIDLESRKIYMTRVGAGLESEREFNF